jgi:glycosyltransferase involved in cell wall biosynthesis
MTKPRTLVVIPALNEADSIAHVVATIRQYLARADIAVINDGSTDLTGEVAQTAAAIACKDWLNAAEAAKSAGLYTVAVPNPMTQHFDFVQADLRLQSLAEPPLSTLLQQAQRTLPS